METGVAAAEAWREARRTGGGDVIGWSLPADERTRLLARFPPKYEQVVADHVTLAAQVGAGAPLPRERSAEIVGISDDGAGVEALVVAIGGTNDRPDGSSYHLTWSLGEGREAVESNAVIRDFGWRPVSPPLTLRIEPARYRG